MATYYNITGSVTEVITLEQAKQQLRIDPIVVHEDAEIEAYITEAREIAENYIGRLIGERNLEVRSSGFITKINAAYTPINSIDSIKAKLDGGTTQTLVANTDFSLQNLSKTKQRIVYVDKNLGALDTIFATPVTVIAKVGFNTTNCPKAIISAMKLILSRLYEFRTDNAQEKTLASTNILRAYKSWS